MTPTLPERVAAQVRAEMARQRVTQQALADHLGLTQGAISRRLAGKVAFDVRELETVAEVLGVPVTQFIPEPAEQAVDAR